MYIVRMQGLGTIRYHGTYVYTWWAVLVDCLGFYYHSAQSHTVYYTAVYHSSTYFLGGVGTCFALLAASIVW